MSGLSLSLYTTVVGGFL